MNIIIIVLSVCLLLILLYFKFTPTSTPIYTPTSTPIYTTLPSLNAAYWTTFNSPLTKIFSPTETKTNKFTDSNIANLSPSQIADKIKEVSKSLDKLKAFTVCNKGDNNFDIYYTYNSDISSLTNPESNNKVSMKTSDITDLVIGSNGLIYTPYDNYEPDGYSMTKIYLYILY